MAAIVAREDGRAFGTGGRGGRSAAQLRRDVARARAAELLERLHLAPLAAANPFTLSGGEQRRLSVATALATDPPLLVLDEPTFGQDRATYAELVVLLRGRRLARRVNPPPIKPFQRRRQLRS